MSEMRRRAAFAAAMGLVGLLVHAGGPAPAPAAPPAVAERAELPPPPMPPLWASEPPPADPAPSLQPPDADRARSHLLTLVAEPKPPVLTSGRPSAIQTRPHDVVQARGDPKPIEGTITEERDGKIWFRSLKGIGHPKNPLVVADLLVLKRQATTVQEAVRERAEKAGRDADAHFALAQECLDADLTAEAEAALRRALALDPAHRAAALKLADLCIVQGKLDAEIGVYEAALTARADFLEAHERLGQRCFELGLFHLARGHFVRGFELAAGLSLADAAAGNKPLPDDPVARRLLRRVAEVLVVGGRRAEAPPLLKLLAVAAPDDPAARNVQALLDILEGRPEQAIAALRQVVEAADAPVSARNNLGAALFNGGDPEGALAHFDACLAAAPRHTKAAVNAALARAVLGRLDEAHQRLAALDPLPASSLAYQLTVACLRERQGKPDEAIAAYAQARTIQPACFHAALGLGRCHLAKGELEPATALFEHARLLRPDDPRAERGLGACRYRAGLFAGAADVLRPLAERDGAEPADLLRLGFAVLRLPEGPREAAALFDRAVAAARPADPYALVARAYLANLAGHTEQAEALFRQAQRAPEASEAAGYAADAVRRIFAARGEEFATLPLGAPGATTLPEGWQAFGQGPPTLEVRDGEWRFAGRSAAPAEAGAVRSMPVVSQGDGGRARAFARFEFAARAPLTNDATVGVVLGVGPSRFQLALRTAREPRLSRRLAYRIARGSEVTPWTDLPGTIALEDLRLGLGLSRRAGESLDVRLNGRTLGKPIPFDALRELPQEVTLGVFAAVEPQQQCLFVVREIELVWKSTPAEEAEKPEGKAGEKAEEKE